MNVTYGIHDVVQTRPFLLTVEGLQGKLDSVTIFSPWKLINPGLIS
jgi:hypothetical protein